MSNEASLDLLKEWILGATPSPTEEQTDIIFSEEEELMIRSSPGSGKTWTACRRFLWRAQQRKGKGGIALLSFTNTAVNEFSRAVAESHCGDLISDPNFANTFDSFVERFIFTPFAHTILNTCEKPTLLNFEPENLSKNPDFFTLHEGKSGRKSPIYAWDVVPSIKDNSLKWYQLKGNHKIELSSQEAKRIVKNLLRSGFYTHEHRNLWAYYILKTRPKLRKILSNRFQEIIVDEAQDTNPWHIIILKYLRKCGSKITLIGDPDQCIYEFSMASSETLDNLSSKWEIQTKFLSRSFRCNQTIASAVNHFGTSGFTGSEKSVSEHAKAYVFLFYEHEEFKAIDFFEKRIEDVGLKDSECAILCRGHREMAKISGNPIYLNLKSQKAQLFAEASFYRDVKKDYKEAFNRVQRAIRQLSCDEGLWVKYDEESNGQIRDQLKLAIWSFVRDRDTLPPISLCWQEWHDKLKKGLLDLFKEINFKPISQFGNRIRKNGIDEDQLALPLLEQTSALPKLPLKTIHKVKGESIHGVLVFGTKSFYDKVLKSIKDSKNTETKRLLYVACSRAKDLLVVALPKKHFEKNEAYWTKWGFVRINQKTNKIN